MKKIWIVLFCLLILFGFSACKPSENTADNVIDVVGGESKVPESNGEESDNTDVPDEPEEEPSVEIPVKDSDEQENLPADDEPEPEVDPDDGESAPTITLVEPQDVTAYLPFTIDLDGDGITEELDLLVADSGEYTGCYHLIVRTEDNKASVGTFIRNNAAVWVGDLDADGTAELFVSGDFASDDYITYALRYVEGTLTPLYFDDAQLWNDESTTRKYTYGKIVSVTAEQIEIRETFDVLGSYAGSLYYAFADGSYELINETIVFADNSFVLTTTQEIPVIFLAPDSETEGTLPVDTQLTIKGTDIFGNVYFQTADGTAGYIVLTLDESGCGFHKIGELDEFDCFAYLPYAG